MKIWLFLSHKLHHISFKNMKFPRSISFFVAGIAVTSFVFVLTSATHNNQDITFKKPHRIVFQMSTADTAAYRALARQLNNVLVAAPTAQLEVVAHNKGIGFLLSEKSNVLPEIKLLKTKGVNFVACENTLKQQKLEKTQVTPDAGFVPVGILEVATRQEQGWAYIKAGF
jgi:intracellular sulfur oxidation DsrE/DsrF family protein